MSNKYDLVVIGSGPGGYAGAIRASQWGAKVALVEKREWGGTCLNRGCVPTKTLLEGVKNLSLVKKANLWGINTKEVKFDFKKFQERKREVVETLKKGLESLFKTYQIDLFPGEGKNKREKGHHWNRFHPSFSTFSSLCWRENPLQR